MYKPFVWSKSNQKPQWFNPIFRFFQEQRYVDDFLKGRIRISTFESFRNAETQERRDEGEGTIEYKIEDIQGSIKDGKYVPEKSLTGKEEFEEAISMFPGNFGNINNLRMKNVVNRISYPDVYALSFTESLNKKGMVGIGQFAAEITNPQLFSLHIANKMHELGLAAPTAFIGEVKYTGRTYGFKKEHPGNPYFIKPADIYSKQKEVRMIWTPLEGFGRVEPVFIDCPEITSLVRQVEPID